MTPTPKTKLLMAFLATGLLAVGALAVGVEAKPGDGPGPGNRPPHSDTQSGSPQAQQDARYHEMCDHPANATVQQKCDAYANRQDMKQDRRNLTQDRKDLRQDRKELRDDVKDYCAHAAANSTAAQRCEHLKDAVKARRVAFGLLTAIRVHERELGRIDFRIDMVKEKLASGNLTGNQTSEANTLLAHLQQRHDSVVQKIKDEQAKLASLRDRWTEVKDHLKDRENAGQDDGGVPADGGAPQDLTPDTGSDSGTAAA